MSQKGEKYARTMERRVEKLESAIRDLKRDGQESDRFYQAMWEAKERKAEAGEREARDARRKARLAESRARIWRAMAVICLAAGLAAALLAAMPLTEAMTQPSGSGNTESGTQERPITVQTIAPAAMEPAEAESRYAALTGEERELIARVIYLEARGEPAEGQQAVAEVILNRVAAENFPDSVEDVVFQEGQFTAAGFIEKAAPGEAQYAAVDAAVYGEPVLPMDVVYFSRQPENGNVWGTIGGHVFCYQYVWE